MQKSFMTKAVRQAFQLEALQNKLEAAQQQIDELKAENYQLRQFMSQDKLEGRAKQALQSRAAWRCY
jgi:cell division protein FtsB